MSDPINVDRKNTARAVYAIYSLVCVSPFPPISTYVRMRIATNVGIPTVSKTPKNTTTSEMKSTIKNSPKFSNMIESAVLAQSM